MANSTLRRLIAALTAGTLVGSVACNALSETKRPKEDAVITIASDLACPSCRIVLEQVAVLSSIGFNGPASAIDRGASGEFYVLDPYERVVKAFGSDGRFLRQIGRTGGGPGEYERVRNVLAAEDGSIHVLDAQLGRHVVFAPDGEYRSSVSAPGIVGGVGRPAVLLSDGSMLLNKRTAGTQEGSSAIQVIDTAGNAFPVSGQRPVDERAMWDSDRLLWRASDGRVIVADPYSFVVDVYASDLARMHSIRRAADWIPTQPPTSSVSDGVFDTPYTPQIRGAWEDSTGLLWMLMVVPAEDWRPGPLIEKASSLSRDEIRALRSRPRIESIVEVVDVLNRRVVARLRLAGAAGLPFGGGYLAKSLTAETEETSLSISRLRLIR